MNREVFDTISETRGERLSVHKDHKRGETVVPYSNGAEVTWSKTAEGDGVRLKEVRTITKIKTPHTTWSRTRYAPGQYEQIFGKKPEEEESSG